tara:strand:+ start:1026 stop:1949 length:924 start_codon:yes stop_codon:yes gene_type:complete
MKNIRTYANDLIEFFHQRYKLQNKPQVYFQDDVKNSQNPLGKTAHYSPAEQSIAIFTTGRHIKDCLRSLAHELVHHMQYERGDLDGCGSTEQGYAQKDNHMREMEREAYEKGNMCFRDWEDRLKQLQETNYKTTARKGDAKMSIKEWKNSELNDMLMEKWGFKPKKGSFLTEGMATYDLSDADYATGQLEETPEELEEEEKLEEEETNPHSTEAKTKALEEKEDLQEAQPVSKPGELSQEETMELLYMDPPTKEQLAAARAEREAERKAKEDKMARAAKFKKPVKLTREHKELKLRETIRSIIKELV